MDIRADEISKIIRDQIGSHTVKVDVAEVGTVISIGDGISRVHGIENAMSGEMLEFPHGVFGIALNLEEDSVGAVLLGEFREIKEGDPVITSGAYALPDGTKIETEKPGGVEISGTPRTWQAASASAASETAARSWVCMGVLFMLATRARISSGCCR